MKNEITIFTNAEFGEIRTIREAGDVWFVAKDVCRVLEHSNSRVAVETLDSDEKGVRKVYTQGGGLSVWQGWSRAAQEQAEIEARREEERRLREARTKEMRERAEREIEYAKQSFEIEKQDAFKKAGDIWKQGERIDAKSDLDETLTGRAFNLAIKKDNLADDGALHSEQRAIVN